MTLNQFDTFCTKTKNNDGNKYIISGIKALWPQDAEYFETIHASNRKIKDPGEKLRANLYLMVGLKLYLSRKGVEVIYSSDGQEYPEYKRTWENSKFMRALK